MFTLANRQRVTVLIGRWIIFLLASALLVVAQNRQPAKNSSQITLIATMPETVGIRANTPGDILDADAAAPHSQSVINSVTTVWCLARGRARMVTVARVKVPNAPPLIALAVPNGVGLFSDSASDIPSTLVFSRRPRVLDTKLDAADLTDANRVRVNRISFSDSIPLSNYMPEDGYVGTMKLQLEAVP